MTRVFVVFALLSFAACIGCTRQVPAVPVQERPEFFETPVPLTAPPCVESVGDDPGGVKELEPGEFDGIIWNPHLPVPEAFYVIKETCFGFKASKLNLSGFQTAELIIRFAMGSRPWLAGPFRGLGDWRVIMLPKATNNVPAKWARG